MPRRLRLLQRNEIEVTSAWPEQGVRLKHWLQGVADRMRTVPELMTVGGRLATARAQTLGWAQAAADNGELGEAIDWLYVAELTHGPLPADWEQTRRAWKRSLTRSTGGSRQ
jgi:hypothetical protein